MVLSGTSKGEPLIRCISSDGAPGGRNRCQRPHIPQELWGEAASARQTWRAQIGGSGPVIWRCVGVNIDPLGPPERLE